MTRSPAYERMKRPVPQHAQAMRRHFHEAAARRGFSVAPAQEAAVERLAHLAGELRRPAWTFPRPPSDLYVWGPVGRGKSWLVDTFYEGLPTGRKRRLHFHDFFRRLHDGVTRPGARHDGQSAGRGVSGRGGSGSRASSTSPATATSGSSSSAPTPSQPSPTARP